jgi:hypothetical protein
MANQRSARGAKERIVSVAGQQVGHERKTSHQRFDGRKAVVAADTEAGLITHVDVLAGNPQDSKNVMEVVERSEEALGERV